MKKDHLVFLLLSAMCASAVHAQDYGNCPRSLAEAYLDANNVRARIMNTGGLFYRGEPHVYTVPRFAGKNPIFAGGIWVGGMVEGELRVSASRYGEWEFWAGPLDDSGNPPVDCTEYDRVYKVSRADVELYETKRYATPDLADWPTGLGAPTLDATGSLIEIMSLPFDHRKNRTIKLFAGERPLISGDQTIWWVMNDRGNIHASTDTKPIGLEVHGMAFAASASINAVNDATLYQYRFYNRGTEPLTEAYLGVFLDPDLGDHNDDYIGADTLLGMGFVYNADDYDGTSRGYGSRPPALGVHILQGPLADDDGVDNNRDGTIDENNERPGMSHFMQRNLFGCYECYGGFYSTLTGRWLDGKRITYGGDGRSFSGIQANFLFPGDPVTGAFWSEINSDGHGTALDPSDRRFTVSSGPFSLSPGETKDFVFSIVWARGEDNLDSVRELRAAAVEVRAAYEAGFSGFESGEKPNDPVSLRSPDYGVDNQTVRPILNWDQADNADSYDVELIGADSTITYLVATTSLRLPMLQANLNYGWRVRSRNSFGEGPWSETWWFVTGDVSFTDSGPFASFSVVQNASGVLDPPDVAAFGFNSSGFPGLPCPEDPGRMCDRPHSNYQQSTTDARWGIHAGGSSKTFGPVADSLSFLGRVTRQGANLATIGLSDYEIRFTGEPGKAASFDNMNSTVDVPFELWNVGIETADDASDDIRLIPVICEAACGSGTIQGTFDIAGDHVISGGTNDPMTDWIYWYEPEDVRTGEDGYNAFFSNIGGLGKEIFAHMVLVQWNGGSDRPYVAELPETGTVFRISGLKVSDVVLSSPGNESRTPSNPVSFYWEGATIDLFRIQISRFSDFNSTIVDQSSSHTGYTSSTLAGGRYYWRIESRLTGWSETWTFEVTDATEDLAIPVRPVLLGNYPNPFSAKTDIVYYLPDRSHVKLNVYDALGRHYGTLVNATQAPGRHAIPFNAKDLSSGIYFYHIQIDAFNSSRMIVLAN